MTPAYVHVVRRSDALVVRGDSHFAARHDLSTEPNGASPGVFAEWDWDGSRLIVRGCRFGTYPIYYFASGNQICVSTSIEPFVGAGLATVLDDSAIATFLRAGSFLGEDTPFAGIRRLPRGGRLEWQADGHWDVSGDEDVIAPEHLTREQALDAFIDLFRDAVRRRPPHGDVILPLSGGRDSRHILMQLRAAGHDPRLCVTARHMPPRKDEDARIAAIVAEALGVKHAILGREPSRVDAELRKNRLTGFSTDWQAWFLPFVDLLERHPGSTIYTGHGGDAIARGRVVDPRRAELWRAGDFSAFATYLLTRRPSRELALELILEPKAHARFSIDRAHARIADELRRYANHANPELAYTFHNILRRRTAPQWFPMCSDLAQVYVPFLDHAVYELLASVPLETDLGRDFHTDAMARAFPELKDLPYPRPGDEENETYPAYFRQFASELTAYVMSGEPSQFVGARRLIERASASHRTGNGRAMEWMHLERVLCLVQLERLLADRDGTDARAAAPAARRTSVSFDGFGEREQAADALVDELTRILPPRAKCLLIDEGFLNAARLEGRECVRFSDRWEPATETRVLKEFTRFKRDGLEFVVCAWPALWWLNHYRMLLERVEAGSTIIQAGDGHIVWKLRTDPPVDDRAVLRQTVSGLTQELKTERTRTTALQQKIAALQKKIDAIRAQRQPHSRWRRRASQIIRGTLTVLRSFAVRRPSDRQ